MSNRLAGETSPYLLQHRDNPVQWYPWGEEALARARQEDKPILLSIGYSACHWCHVMAHESFEDEATAEVMNRQFINIKVDREERPDLDHIYQTAHQMLAQRAGGWPLTMFLSPDGVPFFGGTYFPKTARYGLPGFVQLLEGVSAAWREQREAIDNQNRSMLEALNAMQPEPGDQGEEFDDGPIMAAVEHLASLFDGEWGGFGGAPKFPHATELALLLSRPEAAFRDMALLTLRRMAEGGIFDQLGGGFFRYSVDAHWSIPHFEKMLYDNGLLLKVYADAWSHTRDPLFQRVAEMTAGWVLREMRSRDGGFYSALDADSEGVEGKYYVWSREEIGSLLSDDEYRVFSQAFGLDGPPNLEGKAWHLRLVAPPSESDSLARAGAKVLAARVRRVRPGCDDKILAGWNGLMIEGLLRAGRCFGRGDWKAAGQAGLDFVRRTLWQEGRLLATSKDGRAHLNAYLDDHVYLLSACLESLQVDFRREDYDFALVLADALLERFEDRKSGGFFFTSHDHEKLVQRTKIGHDNATPSGNGMAVLALQRLFAVSGDVRYRDAAERTLTLFFPGLRQSPAGSTTLLAGLAKFLEPVPLVIVRGGGEDREEWRTKLAGVHPDKALVFFLADEHADLPPFLNKPLQNRVNAWVCEGVNCLPPIDSPDVLMEWFSRH